MPVDICTGEIILPFYCRSGVRPGFLRRCDPAFFINSMLFLMWDLGH